MSEFYDKMANAYNDLAKCQSNNQKDLIVTDLHYFIVLKFQFIFMNFMCLQFDFHVRFFSLFLAMCCCKLFDWEYDVIMELKHRKRIAFSFGIHSEKKDIKRLSLKVMNLK